MKKKTRAVFTGWLLSPSQTAELQVDTALTLVEIKFARKSRQAELSFSPCGHPTQVNASWVVH